MASKRRILAVILTVVTSIAIVSVTLGREIWAGKQPGLMSFATIHFAGYLFFLLMPVEALVPFYQAEGHRGLVLLGIAVATAMVAQTVDYGIGRLVRVESVEGLLGTRRFRRFNRLVGRFGSGAILIFNLLPLSSPNLLLVAGIMRFDLRRAALFTLLGLTIKYLALVYLFGRVAGVPG